MTSSADLSQKEMDRLGEIIEDLGCIFSLEEIEAANVHEIIGRLRSEEVKSYLQNLCMGSKPESALREALFAGNSILGKYLYGYAAAPPEVTEDGFVDYLIADQFGHTIILELKSLFDTVKERDRAGKVVVKKLRQQRLSWEAHKDQIKRYITKGEYVILTNLKEWVFFSRSLNPADPRPFYSTSLSELIKDYEVIRNLKDYADRKECQFVRYKLDKKFLDSLKEWVRKLSEVEFTVDDKRKLELIIGLINKFVFIQTLDDYGVIEFKWIQKKWDTFERDWASKSKLTVLAEFLSYVDRFFFKYYDTELFKENFLDYVKKDPDNIERLYDNFRMVLGLTYLQTPIGFEGIMQYNFRLIDEDVLGKAYESFLAEQRKEQGAYYTPKYVTEYIVENTVGRLYDELLKEIEASLESEGFDRALELVRRFTSIKVLDPACGSGSFLIKALRKIKSKYDELIRIVARVEERYYNSPSLDSILSKQDKLERIKEIKDIIGPGDSRELISRLIVRHIHGNDLDRRALEVAKVNIWLEAIKLFPSEFRFDKLPSRVEHILPDLRMNFGNGDTLVGLPENLTIERLNRIHKDQILQLLELRQKYLEDPTNSEVVMKIEEIKHELRKELNEEFERYLKEKNLSLKILDETKPFHWALEYWFTYFGQSELEDDKGFDVVIGNPPWIQSKFMKSEQKEWFRFAFTSMGKQYDIFNGFVEKAVKLLKNKGLLGFILPNRFVMNPDYKNFREYLLDNVSILEIVDVGEEVFEDVEMPALIILMQKENSSERRLANKIRIRLTNAQSFQGQLFRQEFTKTQEAFYKETDKVFTIYAPTSTSNIISKIETDTQPLKIFVKNARGVEIGKKSKIICEQPNMPNCAPFLIGEDIDRYVILRNHYIQLGVAEIDYKDPTLYSPPKIIIRKTGSGIRAVVDYQGYYVIQVIYILKKKDNWPLSLEYIAAVLNSSLMNFYYFEKFGERDKKTFPHLRQTHILSLPIKHPNNLDHVVANHVKELITYKQARTKFLEIWKNWSLRLKKYENTLYKLLFEDDAQFIRTGEFGKVWTTKATFYSTENEILKVDFKDFIIREETNTNIIRIYGLSENGEEQLIYEMEFSDRELMLHIYCSLLQALESKAKINSLFQLLTKTMVPIIKEVNKNSNELTPNIVRKTIDEFGKWVKVQSIGNIEADIVKIDNKIGELEAIIDALVFRIYDLEEDEVKLVLASLKARQMYQEEVLSHLKGLPNV